MVTLGERTNLGELNMHDFGYYLLRFILENPDRVPEVADFIYQSPADSYFGQLGVIAETSGIDLYTALPEVWQALLDAEDDPVA